MSKLFWRNSFIVFLVLFVLTNIIWQLRESPEQAYERGYKDASCDTIPLIDEYGYIATFLVYDSVNKEAVMGARISITELGLLSPILACQITNASGVVGFGLYNGHYSAVADVYPFHSFPPLDFRIESDNYLDTIFFTPIDSTDTMPAIDSVDYIGIE